MIKTIDIFEWESLLIPTELSSEEAEKHSSLVSEYLSRLEGDAAVNLSSIKKTSKIHVDDSLLEVEEIEFNLITNEELFNYFQSEKDEIDSDILFPKTEKINYVFWFLHNLAKEEIANTKIMVSNPEEVSITLYQIIEAAAFFGFLKRTVENGVFYFTPTERYEEFLAFDLEKQYPHFLSGLGSHATISEILQIQLNEPLYDSISKRMVHNILVNDPNIQKESLSNDEVKKIVNSLRYWYLAIRKNILVN